LLENSEDVKALIKQSSPSDTLFTTSEPPAPINDKSTTLFFLLCLLSTLHLSNDAEVGLLARGLQFLHPKFLKNDGVCTRSQTAKQKVLKKDLNINSLKDNCLPCFENCINNGHSKSCLQKAVNFMEKGDIYTSQKAYHKHNLDLNFDQEGDLEEEEEEQNNLGLGGSSPIPSLHHSFDAEETLQDI
jgi:hypothetical protein